MDTEAKYRCPCCGFLTLDSPAGGYDICPVCYWEDDIDQSEDIELSEGANSISLRMARQNYKDFGASEYRFIGHVRAPYPEEI